MKFPWHAPQSPKEWALIAAFNGARIVGNSDGKIIIRGGTPAERAEARAWREQYLIETPLYPSTGWYCHSLLNSLLIGNPSTIKNPQ